MRRFALPLLILSVLVVVSLSMAQDGSILIHWDPDQTTVSGSVTVHGTVNPPGLQSYFLEAAEYDPDAESPVFWTPILLPVNQQAVQGVLGEWNTALLPDGVYQLRLHVILTSGESVYYTIAPIAIANKNTITVDGPVRVIATPGAAVLTALPTNTPTPRPTATPRPIAANRLPLEVGGHVLHFSPDTQGKMREAGMTWVKWQIPFVIGDGTDYLAIARDRIVLTHNAGFRILLSVTGEVHQLDEMGADYYPVYAAFLGQVAALGADAIEVWNEMNLDREWPTGKIDPRAYVEMLRPAYEAIKAANSSTLVITGALAPTGAEGAFGSARVWNDDRYYLGMANAGAADYADCIGVHYNEGIIAPNLQGGDPRGDGYPTRYLPLMLERVAWPFRATNTALCFTELGYLSPEGYGPLPGNFAWAANTSVQEQAQWLAQAITITANYGRLPVRLLIVWNIDFEQYGDDPQAGYAIIRPDGSCPACETIGSLR